MTTFVRSPRQGVGDYDATVFDAPKGQREERIAAELRRLERACTDLLIDSVGPVARSDRVLHAGRSVDTVGALEQRFGCLVDEDQDSFAACADDAFDVVVDDDIHPRGDLFAHYAELGRLMRPQGRYVLTTWCINDQVCRGTQDIKRLDRRVGIEAKPRAKYLAALTSNGFVPYVVADLTQRAIPYWRLRLRARQQTGVEEAFLAAYVSQAACLLLVAAERYRPPSRPHRRRQPAAPASGQPWPPREPFGLAWN